MKMVFFLRLIFVRVLRTSLLVPSSLCGRLGAFLGGSLLGVPLDPQGSPLGSPWVSLRPLGGPLPGQIALFLAPCLECFFLVQASYYKWPFPGLGASPARFPYFWPPAWDVSF